MNPFFPAIYFPLSSSEQAKTNETVIQNYEYPAHWVRNKSSGEAGNPQFTWNSTDENKILKVNFLQAASRIIWI